MTARGSAQFARELGARRIDPYRPLRIPRSCLIFLSIDAYSFLCVCIETWKVSRNWLLFHLKVELLTTKGTRNLYQKSQGVKSRRKFAIQRET